MIGQYSLYEWLIFFYIYSFFGWVFESAYVSFKKRKWVNRGFLMGPFLPIYGGGAVMMLFVLEPFQSNLILTYFAGAVGATLLELATGVVMESIFKIKYWDYSSRRFNYKGYICLASSILWGFCTVLMNEVIHPALLLFLETVPAEPLYVVFGIISVFLIFDIVMSVKEALDLRNMLEKMENLREEMLHLRKRADEVIACLDDNWKNFVGKNPAIDKVGEIYKDVELRYNKLKQSVMERDILTDAQKEELSELREHFTAVLEQIERFRKARLHQKSRKHLRIRILGNPTMTSVRYRFSLEALKERIRESREEEPKEE